MCRLDATGTLSKFWSLIKNNLDEPIVPKDNIKKVFEGKQRNGCTRLSIRPSYLERIPPLFRRTNLYF